MPDGIPAGDPFIALRYALQQGIGYPFVLAACENIEKIIRS
jgi:hypothetical protein